MFPTNKARPRLRAGLTRPITVTPKRMPSELLQPSSSTNSPRVPLRPVQPTPPSSLPANPPVQTNSNNEKLYFSVLYTKRSKKKHKSWLDGYVILTKDRVVELLNENGKKISVERYSKALGGLRSGNTLEFSTWQLEVQNPVSGDDYISGRLFAPSAPTKSSIVPRKQKQFTPLRPLASSSTTINPEKAAIPMHDPNAPDAIVLLPGNIKHNQTSIPVVLDPFLGKRMRPHQHDGIRFLFECTAGRLLNGNEAWEGAILADEMGLGKSLQAIALIWTLLKQGPEGKPLAKKAIIVCPASLVRNWVNEVRKWLGDQRLKPVALESGVSTYESKEAMASFIGGNVRKLLVISYEMFRSNATQLYDAQCGLIICDEGHRLKSAGGNKTIDALRKLPCRRRVILTGTPVQNDLEEFFAVCDFVNPGCLNSLASFRAVFANPIIASRDSNATLAVKELGEARAKELSRITSKFVLRRTSSILEKYLPPKHETAIFCRLQEKQQQDYEREACRRYVDIMGTQGMSFALRAINFLRKICSHPFLMTNLDEADQYNSEDEGYTGIEHDGLALHDSEAKTLNVNESSKMQVTASICKACLLKQDRVIIVSNFTTVLNLMEDMLKQLDIKFCRLDGSTAVNQRSNIVRRFNEGSLGDVFLLSAKAGGVGLNLIGANRLILFDPDWNPATDVQAMARVWRDGQKKHVFVYRLLCTGTIEEKIFQRQLFKGELQDAVDGDKEGGKSSSIEGIGKDGNFKAEELKDVFNYNGDVRFCETLNVLERSKEDKKKAGLLEQFKAYKDVAEKEQVDSAVWCEDDEVLDIALNGDIDTHGVVSYLYTKKFGAVLQNDVNSSVKELKPNPKRSGKRKLASYLSSDSEKEQSEDELGESLAERVFNKKSIKQQCQLSTPIVEVLDEEISTTEKDERSVDEGGNSSSRKVQDVEGKVKEGEGGNGVVDLTWDDAINELDDM